MPRHPPGAARARTVDAARDLFYAHGYPTVTLDDVAQAAGVSKNTIYAHFPTKDALVGAALDQQGDALLVVIRAALAEADGPAARIHAVFAVIDHFAARPVYRGCPYLNVAAQTPDRDHPLHEQVRRHKDELRDLFRAELTALGVEDPDATADELLLVLDGTLVHAAMRPDAHPVRTAHRLVDAVLARPFSTG